MTKKAYVVVSISFDYDDNYYRSHDGSPGDPIHVFADKELADKVCRENNVKELLSLTSDGSIRDYMQDGIDEREVRAFKKAGFGIEESKRQSWINYYISSSPSKLSVEQAEELLNSSSLEWYKVVEVDATVDYFYKTRT